MPENKDSKDKSIDVNTAIHTKPGEEKIIQFRPGGEPDETRAALNKIEKTKLEREKLTTMERADLEREYQRINSDFDLSLQYPERLQAILGVLVEKYNISPDEIRRLRGI